MATAGLVGLIMAIVPANMRMNNIPIVVFVANFQHIP